MGLTVADVHSRVRSILNDSGQQIFQTAEITNYINDWIRDVAADCNAFQKTATFSTTASTRTYSLAGDFIAVAWVIYNATSGSGKTLKEASWNQMKPITTDPMTTTGTPYLYYLERTPGGTSSVVNTVMGLYPVPSTSSVTVRYFYYYAPTALSAFTDKIPLPYGFDEGCIYYVCEKLKLKDREFGEADKFKKLYEQEADKLKKKLTASPNMHRRMGSDATDTALYWPGLDPSKFSIP